MTFYEEQKKTRDKIAMIFEMTPIWSTNFFLFCIFCLFKRSQIFYKKKNLCVNKIHKRRETLEIHKQKTVT